MQYIDDEDMLMLWLMDLKKMCRESYVVDGSEIRLYNQLRDW